MIILLIFLPSRIKSLFSAPISVNVECRPAQAAGGQEGDSDDLREARQRPQGRDEAEGRIAGPDEGAVRRETSAQGEGCKLFFFFNFGIES